MTVVNLGDKALNFGPSAHSLAHIPLQTALNDALCPLVRLSHRVNRALTTLCKRCDVRYHASRSKTETELGPICINR
jgi:hypothetical protein